MGHPAAPHKTHHPLVSTVAIFTLAGVYLVRLRQIRRAGVAQSASRVAAFGAGILALLIALASPVAALSERMFLWHMVQHILLVDLAPVLLLAAATPALLEPLGTRARESRRILAALALPGTGVLLYAGTLWAWHAPPLYDAALANPIVHGVQHVTFLAAGVVFWWHVFGPHRAHRHVRGPGVFTFMAVTKFATGVLAGLLVFLPEAGFVYESYASQPRMWGLSATRDQQLGGSIMIIEEITLMTAAFGFMFVRMLTQADEDDERRDRDAETAVAS